MLTTNDLGCVLEEVIVVSAQWYPLGLQLKVETGELDSIKLQFSSPRDQLLEMLKIWLRSGDNTSWKTLTDALRSRSVGYSKLASALETKYCLMEETEVNCSEFFVEHKTETTTLDKQKCYSFTTGKCVD